MIPESYHTLTVPKSLPSASFYSKKRNILGCFKVCSKEIQYQQNSSDKKTHIFIQFNENLYKNPVFTGSLVCINYCIFKKSYIPD